MTNIQTVCISFVLVIAVYVIYWKGPVLRKRSKFAQQLSNSRAEKAPQGRRESRVPLGSRASSFARSEQNMRFKRRTSSRQGNAAGAPEGETHI